MYINKRMVLAFVVFIGVLVAFFYLLQNRKTELTPIPAPEKGLLATRKYTEPVFLGDKKLLSIKGTVQNVELKPTNFTFDPEQYFLTLRSSVEPSKVITVGLGGSERSLVLKISGNKTEPNAIVQKTVLVKELIPLLQEGKVLSVELDFTSMPENVQSEFLSKLTAFENERDSTLDIFYMFVSKIIIDK